MDTREGRFRLDILGTMCRRSGRRDGVELSRLAAVDVVSADESDLVAVSDEDESVRAAETDEACDGKKLSEASTRRGRDCRDGPTMP